MRKNDERIERCRTAAAGIDGCCYGVGSPPVICRADGGAAVLEIASHSGGRITRQAAEGHGRGPAAGKAPALPVEIPPPLPVAVLPVMVTWVRVASQINVAGQLAGAKLLI